MAEVYVMTECYATNADSDDLAEPGTAGGYPMPRLRVFSSQDQAIEYARLWVAEDFGDDEAWHIDRQEPRGNMVFRAEIIGPYSTHWVEVQRQEIFDSYSMPPARPDEIEWAEPEADLP